jgi:hypothetical protein
MMFSAFVVGTGTGISYSVVMGTLLQLFGQGASAFINAYFSFIYGLGGMIFSILYFVQLVNTPALLLVLFIVHACGIIVNLFFTIFSLQCLENQVAAVPINESTPLVEKKEAVDMNESFGVLFKRLLSGADTWIVLLILMLMVPVGSQVS